jgi:hypothetical protein
MGAMLKNLCEKEEERRSRQSALTPSLLKADIEKVHEA